MACIHKCAGRCHYETTLSSLLKGVASGRGYWGLEKRKCHSSLQKGQDGGPGVLEDSQPHLRPWKPDGGHNPGNNVYVYESQEGDLKYSTWACEGESCTSNLIAF